MPMRRFLKYLTIALLFLTGAPVASHAQFKKDAFTQNYNADSTAVDTTDTMFSFREYFGGVTHKEDARIGVMFAGSMVFVGGQQMGNRQYWKLPLVYGTIGGAAGAGIVYRNKWHDSGDKKYQHLSNWFFAGAGLAYWGALMDGVVNYKKDIPNQAGKATLYSLLFPGLGQAYNGEYWKIPIYYGFLVGSCHYLMLYNKNYQRYKRIHNQATTDDSGYTGPISAETALYYRNIFRRYRDYSIVALAGVYLLQVIDANVFSYMHDFELNDDIAMSVSPSVITDEPAFAYNPYQSGLHYSGGGASGIGLRIGFTF